MQFLKYVVEKFPYAIDRIQTDNGSIVTLQTIKKYMGKAIDFLRFIVYNINTVTDEGWDFPLLY